MKTKLILIVMILCAGILSCDNDDKVADPIYEFVSFAGDDSVPLNEIANATDGYPLVVQLWVFQPFTEDVDITFEVTGTNAQEGVDYTVSPDGTVKVEAGKLTSDTIWIKTINNDDANELARTFHVALKTISKGDLKIGLGISDPQNASIDFTIVDDECSGDPLCIFNTTLVNNIDGDELPATSTVNKISQEITLVGNLINYDPFDDATLVIKMTPDSQNPNIGTATFGEQETGTDNDGYKYKFIQTGDGSYNATAGTITISFDIYYEDGGWVYWYSVTNELSIP